MSVPHATTTATRRRGPLRWAIALLASVALVVSGSGLVAFAQGGAGASRSAEWTPAGTPILIIARADLPAGQEEALASAMTAFPGFADSGSFRLKIDQALDGLIGDATDGAVNFTGEIQSFFSGEIGLALPNVMEAALSGGDDPDILLGIAINDRGAAESFLALMTASSTDSRSEEDYAGSTIVSDDSMALALTDEWILVSQQAELVKAGLDTLAGNNPSLADSENYAAAAARVPDGHLAQAYIDLSSFGDLIAVGVQAAGPQAAGLVTQDLLDQLPTDMIAYLAAGDSTMTVEAFISPGATTPTMPVGESDLASAFPATAQVYFETRELGAGIGTGLTTLLESLPPEDAAQLAPIGDMLGTDVTQFLDFLGDTAVGASLTDNALWVGIVSDVTDEATATTRLERGLSLVRLLGAGAETGISIEEEDVNGTNVTTITLPVEQVAGDVPLPFDIGDTISVAVADGRFLLGSGDFVATSLALDEVDSLALSPGYVDALADDTANSGVLYANIGDLIMTIDPLLGLMVPQWSDVSPWVGGLDRFIAVGGTDDEVISTRMTLHVETP
jgi:hypothetical protein